MEKRILAIASRLAVLSLVFVSLTAVTTASAAESYLGRRVRLTSDVLLDRQTGGHQIPSDIVAAARCIVSLKTFRAAWGIGAEFSTGMASCRVGKKGWSKPSFVYLVGPSIGWQAGAELSDVVLVFMTDKSRHILGGASIKFGADIDFAVGPFGQGVGRGRTRNANVYAYARNLGLYAGVSLDGVALAHNGWFNRKAYSGKHTPAELLSTRADRHDRNNARVKPFLTALHHLDSAQ